MLSFLSSYIDFQRVNLIVGSLFFVCFYDCGYSESLYALLSVGGLYYLKSRSDNIALFWFALSGFARSNGVHAGYFGFKTMHQAYDAAFLRKRAFVSFLFSLVTMLIFW